MNVRVLAEKKKQKNNSCVCVCEKVNERGEVKKRVRVNE